MSNTTTVNHADGSTSYTVPDKTDNDAQDINANAPKLIGDAAYNSADNANGNVAGTTPPIRGYQGR